MTKTTPSRTIDPIDIQVGARLRQARTLRGVSQDRLAKEAEISFQQVQKYEKGINRIAPSRLQRFANLLGVTPGWFFESDVIGASLSGDGEPFPTLSAETIQIAKTVAALPLPIRRRLLSLATALRESQSDADDEQPQPKLVVG